MKEEIKNVLFAERKDLKGKNLYLALLINATLGGLGCWFAFLVAEHASYKVYQVFVLCIIALVVIAAANLRRKITRENENSG